MRTLSRRREEYVGEWLPEPLLTSPDVAEDFELAESVSMAMLTVLETLEPTERPSSCSTMFSTCHTPRSPRRSASPRPRCGRSPGGHASMWPLGGRVQVNGQVAAVSLVVENGRVSRIYAVANPEKLTRLDELAELIR